MRKLVIATMCVSLAACSQKTESSASDQSSATRMTTSDVAEPAAMIADGSAMRAPGISVTAAPGVAFAYHYAFRMPSEGIARAQELHAQACEKLGIARCRITGMRYRLLGENNIEAMLAFKLDPALARGFGKDGIAAIVAAQGKLVDAEITGNDAGAAIKQLDVQRTRYEEEIRRIDQQLAGGKLSRGEREELQRQRAQLVAANSAVKDSSSDQQDSLATTPMVFDYGSGAAVRGFDPSAPLTSAADTAIGSAQITLAVLLGLLALLGPPALVVIAVVLAWRRFVPRRTPRPRPDTAPS